LFCVVGLVKEEPGGMYAVRLVDAVTGYVKAAIRAQRVPELFGCR
jgi:hypothetical protein